MIKKILAIFLGLSVCLPGITGEAEKRVFEPSHQKEAVDFLKDLGLVDGELLKPGISNTVTRGELAYLVSGMVNLSPYENAGSRYNDVSGTEYEKYIYAVTDSGIMKGVSETGFNPDESITFHQAAVTVVRILGGGFAAEMKGGYPYGYIAMGEDFNLFDGVPVTEEIPISRASLLRMLYNAAICETDISDMFGKVHEEETLLSYYHGIYEDEGIVEADGFMSMTSKKTLTSDEISVSGTVYKKPVDKFSDMVGRRIKFYYSIEGDERYLLTAKKYKSFEITLSVDDELTLDYEKGVYELDGESYEEFEIGSQYDVIYNFSGLKEVTKEKLLPECGSVTLIDNDKDDIYEVVIVKEFYNVVVDTYNSTYNIIFDIFPDETAPDGKTSRNIELDEYETVKITDVLGNDYDLNTLKLYDVLEVYRDRDGEDINVLVEREKVSGKITKFDDGKITVNSKEMRISKDVRSDAESLSMGIVYDFYLNTKGEIVFWTQTASMRQGYVLKVMEEDEAEFNVYVKILSSGGDVIKYPIADKVKVMNYGKNRTVKKEDYNLIFPESREFILYELDSDKKISTVVHAHKVMTREEFNSLPSYPLFRLDNINREWVDPWNNNIYYKASINGFDNYLLMSDDALVYKVPAVSDTDYYEDSLKVSLVKSTFYTDYDIKHASEYGGSAGTMITYMVGDCYPYANVMIEHFEGGTDDSGDSIINDLASAVVTKLENVYDEKRDEAVWRMEINEKGTVKTLIVDNEDVLKRESFSKIMIGNQKATINEKKERISVGDIIKYSTNSSSRVKAIALMFDSDNKELCYQKAGFGSEYNLIYGIVTLVRNGVAEVEMVTGTVERYKISALPTTVVDKKKRECFQGDASNVEVGDGFARQSRFATNVSLTVYKAE